MTPDVTPGAAVRDEGDTARPAAVPAAIAGRLGRALALRSTASVGERAIVIEHREPLIYMLCAAAELEHALMCEYLFAAFSLKRSVEEGLTEEQLVAVNRWRATILLVAKQEMMHLAINCNLVTSLGASPHLSRANLPQPAKHYPAGVRLALLPFGEQALRHFLFLERPEGMDIDDAEGIMFDVIEPLADILTTLPVGPEHRGRTAGATFELFYQPDYLLPHRRAAWLLMAEHLSDAADLASVEDARDARFQPIADALRTHADALQARAH